MTISGERKAARPDSNADTHKNTREDIRTYAQERFAGSFRRVIELPETTDPDKVQARYLNGCLSISVGKRESSKPRAIAVQ